MPVVSTAPRWALFGLLLGLYLTAFGYHSRDGDQAYRLPLLLHYQDPDLYAADPFVRAFDTFQPHLGYLALLDAASRAVGLSAALAILYVVTFMIACAGLDRLASAAWPGAGARVGVVAVGLVLAAKAGNIGTFHLFEPMLLDRGIGFALGWFALGEAVEAPGRGRWTAPIVLGLAALVHPSVGLQLAMVLGAGWIAWGVLGSETTGVRLWLCVQSLALLAVAMLPSLALNAGQSARLFAGMDADDFRAICLQIQNPQHMLPHLWRTPQWLAWGCFFALAATALGARAEVGEPRSRWPQGRVRLVVLLGVNLIGLAAAWAAIEVFQNLRITVLQPFRMATVARGLALVIVADRVLRLWNRDDFFGWARAALLVAGLTGDRALVVVTAVELAIVTSSTISSLVMRSNESARRREWIVSFVALITLGWGLVFLARHDTELGHRRLLLALAGAAAWTFLQSARARWPMRPADGDPARVRRRLSWALAAAWTLPIIAMVAPIVPGIDSQRGRVILAAFAERWRFTEVPTDDLERLALWCRGHTEPAALFIGPPGPKTFRLWSRRCLAFNRAASPYHAEGLADWFARFCDHVNFASSPREFARAYLADRQSLERRYQQMTDAQRAQLAVRQGATYIVASAPKRHEVAARQGGGLELLHVEGRYAVYRLAGGEPDDTSLVSMRDVLDRRVR
jgi:hypothetical protein